MNESEAFSGAKWITSSDKSICPIFRKCFDIQNKISAKIRIVGFSSFVFFINGKRASDDYFMPFASDYEPRNSPAGEELRHRTYVCEYDVTELIRNGRNALAVILGDGWYTGHTGIYKEIPYGDKKLCFNLSVKTDDGDISILSDESVAVTESYVKYSDLNFGERQDHSDWDNAVFSPEFDDSIFQRAVFARSPDTEYHFTDCPPDRIISRITPTLLRKEGNLSIYDATSNLTGFPVLIANKGSSLITVKFSEDLNADGTLNEKHSHKQSLVFNTGGREIELSPLFTWFGFRYFSVEGDADVSQVVKVHSAISINSGFECENPTLNWIYGAYLNTQLTNMHQGIPSDCPHIERRGYTGDGQLTCRAAMLMLNSERFYSKWIDDILDCQDKKSGHIQYTAPYTASGGGPGGWGCAIAKVPYEFYKAFGDEAVLEKSYYAILKYFEYMEAHSEFGLVTSDEEGKWCLGEWCVPAKHPGNTVLPPAFINTYFYVKALKIAVKIASILNKGDAPLLLRRIAEHKSAIKAAYYNPNNGNFLDNRDGANAFALDIGLGDERTKENFIAHYDTLGYYDTGIFGTDIVTRLLFEYGRSDIAIRLLSASEPHGFGKWREDGETTLPEYWKNPRSKNHPMFGAVSAYLFDHVLGIRQDESSVGYEGLIISPSATESVGYAKGYITCKHGRISVEYHISSDSAILKACIPEGISATVKFLTKEISVVGPSRIILDAFSK